MKHSDRTQPIPRPILDRRWRWRMLVLLAVQVVVLVLMSVLFDSIKVESVGAGLLAVIVIGLLDAIVWPFMVRYTLSLMVLTVGLFSFFMNAVVILVADELVDGFEVTSGWMSLFVAAVLALASGITGSVLSIDDDDTFQRTMVRRAIREGDRHPPTDEPGFLFIQIDGLSHDVLAEAMRDGHAPTMAAMVDGGSHRLLRWECDLSSQTGAMQAGILLGNNENMPAFRWYDKDLRRVLVSNSPKDASAIEARQSSGDGLLRDGGASRGNVFSGDAQDALFTFSQLRIGGGPKRRLASLFASAHGLFRILGLFVADIWREIRANRVTKRDDIEPRLERGGVYPLLRSAVTVGLTEITTATLAGDIYRGVPTAYADLVGYDEVAHHSGIRRPESLDTLRRIDDRIRRLTLGFQHAPRPYELVILSDHGQTQGANFEQRYGQTFEELIESLTESRSVIAPGVVSEGWGNVNGILTDMVHEEESFAGRTLRRALRKRMVDGDVEIGPSGHVDLHEVDDEIIVLASGNLGIISFAGFPRRVSLEDLTLVYPRLVTDLSAHPGIGFVMVHSEVSGGGVVVGAEGLRHLRTGEVEGTDPLAPFGPNAARHLRRTDQFANCPDLVVNSFYDPVTEEGCAFEHQVGFHGGLGGLQTAPFVLAPSHLSDPDEELIGAESVHRLFQRWIREERPTDVVST